jgi:demethylmenaquinone methyltransferase / 2-methoxy-6-polyprenyl-1,4-benzoquinol methylase
MPAEQGLQQSAAPRGSSPGRLEADQVREMFDRIAGVYDALNTAMTAGLHRRWRERAADLARVAPGSSVLDVATGTGDLALELARRVAPDGEVIGSDFSERMLERARAKASNAHAPGVMPRFQWGDALALEYPDGRFDAATVGFGARNFSDLDRGLREMTRVVRPGGRVVVLELATPTEPPLQIFFSLWFDRLVPGLGRVVGALERTLGRVGGACAQGGIAEAYAYLPSSVKRFPAPAELAAAMARAGLQEISYLLTAGGIISIHAGTVSLEANR